jgi:hypothetical protein
VFIVIILKVEGTSEEIGLTFIFNSINCKVIRINRPGLLSHKVSNGVQNVPNGVHVRYKISLNGVHRFSENSG